MNVTGSIASPGDIQKIREMPTGCLKESRARQDRRKTQATPRKVLKRNASRVSKSDTMVSLEEKCQTGIHKRVGRDRTARELERRLVRA
jgi:hypothetical protein